MTPLSKMISLYSKRPTSSHAASPPITPKYDTLPWAEPNATGLPLPILKTDTLEGLQDTFERLGACYLHSPGLTQTMATAIAQTEAQFKRPPSELARYDEFVGVDVERTGLIYGTPDRDHCAKYTYRPTNTRFPDEAFQHEWDLRLGEMTHIAARVLNQIQVKFGIIHPQWAQIFESPKIIRHLSYPDVSKDRAEGSPVRMAAHADIGLISLIFQTPSHNGYTSLQVKVGSDFVDVPAVRDTLVILCGQVLTCLTNGKVPAAIHRVVNPPPDHSIGSARTSTVCFFNPPDDFSFLPTHPLLPDQFSKEEQKTPHSFARFKAVLRALYDAKRQASVLARIGLSGGGVG